MESGKAINFTNLQNIHCIFQMSCVSDLNRKRNFLLMLICLITITICMILVYNIYFLSFERLSPKEQHRKMEIKFVVNKQQCKIPHFEPMNSDAKKSFIRQSYEPCTNKSLLTYISKSGYDASIHVNKSAVAEYTKDSVFCCYMVITRDMEAAKPDSKIKLTKPRDECFEDFEPLAPDAEYLFVACNETESNRELYRNVHAVIRYKESVADRLNVTYKQTPFNVILLGLDGMSRLSLMRNMPETHKFLMKSGWISMNGYNQVGDNTFPNVCALMTGLSEKEIYRKCDPRELGKMDNCSMNWYDYRKLGYITAYGEDEVYNIFMYLKQGFKKAPTDYYLRPLGEACIQMLPKREIVDLSFCSGPEQSGERLMNALKDFALTFRHHPTFAFFWLNSFSHSSWDLPSAMDLRMLEYLRGIEASSILDDTIFIFLSDHGFRWGKYLDTEPGWFENKLPFMFFRLPERFQRQFPSLTSNLRSNFDKLITAYDLYVTLQEILSLSGMPHQPQDSPSCPECKSLFTSIPDRSCNQAAIPPQFCTCAGYVHIPHDNEFMHKAAEFLVKVVNQNMVQLGGEDLCQKYTLKKVTFSRISLTYSDDNSAQYLIGVETSPYSLYTAAINFNYDQHTFSNDGSVVRANAYRKFVGCIKPDKVKNARLEKVCNCKIK